MNLLLVDDEVEIVNGILAGIDWDALGFDHIFACNSGKEAMQYFEEHTVDIMLCDIEMPFFSGLELLNQIREQGYETECIFLTCHEKFDYARDAIKLQTYDYLLKPVPYSELQRILKKVKDSLLEKRMKGAYEEQGRVIVQSLVEKQEMQNKAKEITEEVKRYILKHLSEDLSADKLAAQVYISPDYLFKIFKREEKMTLVEYITRERMFCAWELLKKPDLTVSQVAISVGYNNYCYFIKIFKKLYGKSPSEHHREFVKKNREATGH